MRALYVEVPPEIIARRRQLGLDLKDEMWEGVYHMVPPPTWGHQHLVGDMYTLFQVYVKKHALGTIALGAGVRDMRSPDADYRIPEWAFLRAGRESLLQRDSGYIDQGPDVVLEVRSPDDETDDKIPFYERMEVRELLIIDRDTCAVALHRNTGGRFRPVSPNLEGWTYCEGLRAFFRADEHEGNAVLRVLLELDRTEHAI